MAKLTAQEFLQKYRPESTMAPRPMAVLGDMSMLSIQASYFTNSNPKDKDADSYTEVEVWCWPKDQGIHYLFGSDSDDEPGAYVPIEIVEEYVKARGGITAIVSPIGEKPDDGKWIVGGKDLDDILVALLKETKGKV